MPPAAMPDQNVLQCPPSLLFSSVAQNPQTPVWDHPSEGSLQPASFPSPAHRSPPRLTRHSRTLSGSPIPPFLRHRQELENAIHWHKPLVLCMLDQTAWNLLTTLGGHREAWEEEPASGGYPLSRFEGQSFGPLRVRFSLERVERIFNTLASINFCPCRELDFANMGAASVAERLNEFVAKDLGYTKEHAFLQSRAEAWCAAERPNGFLLEGRTDVQKWTDWIKMATRAGFFPTPTREQQEYVKASSRRHLRRLNFQKSAGVSLVVLIFLLMVASSALACWAIRQRNLVAQQRELAVWQQRVATSLALSSELRPQLSSQARGMLRAAEIAESIGFPALMLPALTSTVNYLTSLRYWFLDLDAHRDRVTGVAFSPDGRWVASGSEDHTVRIRELPPYRSEAVGVEMLPPFRHSRELRCQGGVVSVAWSPSGDLVAAGCREASEGEPPAVFVWRVDPRAGCWGEAHRLNMTGPSSAKGLAWSHDGELLAAGSDQAIVVWRIGETERSAGPPEALKLQRGRWSGQVKARSLAWHPGRYLLAAGGTDTYLAVWDIDGVVAGIPSPVAAAWFGNIDINAVAFSGDGRLLASGDDYRQVLIWDMERVSVTAGGEGDGEVQELKLKHRLPRHGDVVSGLAWSAAGDLASCSHDGTGELHGRDGGRGAVSLSGYGR